MIEGYRPKEFDRRSLRIGIDIDDVVSNHFKNVISKFNSQFGTNFTLEDISSFYFLESVNVGNREERIRLLRQFYSDNDTLFDQAEPIDGAVETIQQLASESHEIHFISSRDIGLLDRTQEWLSRYGLPVTATNVHLIKPEDMDAVQFKIRKSHELALNVVVEDDSRIAVLLDIPVILLDYAWNREVEAENILRALNWNGIYSQILKLSR